MSAISLRQRQLLSVVEDLGESDARSIDMTISTRHGPSETSVRSELLELAELDLLSVDEARGVGGSWTLTAKGRDLLEGAHRLRPPRDCLP